MTRWLLRAVALAALAAGPALAQSQAPSLNENDIREKLRAEGFTEVSNLRREEDLYKITAAKEGRPYGVLVDARSGKILDVAPPEAIKPPRR